MQPRGETSQRIPRRCNNLCLGLRTLKFVLEGSLEMWCFAKLCLKSLAVLWLSLRSDAGERTQAIR